MPAAIDMKVIELLSARMCHDLISPVSAIANGIELVTEFDDQLQGEALGLIGDSAGAASRLLQFYRAAFGSARSAEGGTLGLPEARQRVLDCIGGGRIEIVWPESGGDLSRQISRNGLKLLMNLALASSDVLPGDGRLRVDLQPSDAGVRAVVSAEKEGLASAAQFRDAFTGKAALDDLSPRTVVAYFCCLIADDIGSPLEVAEDGTGLSLSCILPWA